MFVTLVYYCLALLAACVLSLIISNTIFNSYAYLKLKKNSKGLPILGGFRPVSSHVNSFFFKNHLMHHVSSILKEAGSQTAGFIFSYQPMVVTHDLELVKRVITEEKSINRTRLNMAIKEVEFDSIMLSKDDQWRRIRKAFAPALKSTKFQTANVQKEIDDSISKLIDALETKLNNSETGQIEQNMDDLLHRYALDLVLSCFYKQNNLVSFDLSKPDPMAETVNGGLLNMQWNPMARASIIFPILRPFMDWFILNFTQPGTWRKLISKLIMEQTKVSLIARKQIQRSKAAGEQVDEENFMLDSGIKFSRNMIDHIIDHYHDGKLTQKEYVHSTFFLLNAADKTSADSLVHTIYQMAIREDIQEKLRESIRTYGAESEYLSWVISESLRILPPALIGCSRMVERDLEIEKGHVIPAKTFLVTPVYSIHRLPQYWGPDANEFKPERFAKTDHFHPLQYIPFGAGARMCPGREFALHEMKKILCALFSRYKFQCEPMENRYNAPLFVFLVPDKHTYIRISRLD